MGCIEMSVTYRYYQEEREINSNMGCIEIQLQEESHLLSPDKQ